MPTISSQAPIAGDRSTAGELATAAAAAKPQINSPRISYVLATKNRAGFLRKALERVRQWIQPQDELIVVDGGSTDDTRAVVNAHASLVTRFISEPDRGEAHAFNKGVLIAHGEYVKFLTDDDQLFAEGLRQAAGVLERSPEIDVLICGGESYLSRADGSQSFQRHISLAALGTPGR